MTMEINVRFFASVREAVGSAQEAISVPADVTSVGDVRALLVARGGVWAEALSDQRPLRMACNQVMCASETVLTPGCEVAFFPPVTGG
jgi:molybdopterin synthase sulfur carrier subunit